MDEFLFDYMVQFYTSLELFCSNLFISLGRFGKLVDKLIIWNVCSEFALCFAGQQSRYGSPQTSYH